LNKFQTLKILRQIDINIVESYYSKYSQSFSAGLSLKHKNEFTARLLDVLEICAENGEIYAQRVKELCEVVDIPSAQSQPVLERAVEMVLLHIQDCEHILVLLDPIITNIYPTADSLFRIGCVTTIIASVVDVNTKLGPTLIVIISALASEYCGRLAIPPVDILLGLASRLSLYTRGTYLFLWVVRI
jgi:AP-4 complex subunit epsilon-1